jgi:hypothetical protein
MTAARSVLHIYRRKLGGPLTAMAHVDARIRSTVSAAGPRLNSRRAAIARDRLRADSSWSRLFASGIRTARRCAGSIHAAAHQRVLPIAEAIGRVGPQPQAVTLFVRLIACASVRARAR